MKIVKGRLIDLVDENRNYTQTIIIPEFQRGYSWDENQVKDLFNDLKKGFENKQIKGFSSMGVFYFFKDKKESKLEIIDGQQRLTSLLILIEAIRMNLNAGDVKHSIYDKMGKRVIKGYHKECRLEKMYVSFFDNFVNHKRENNVDQEADADYNGMLKNFNLFEQLFSINFKNYKEKIDFYIYLLEDVHFYSYLEEEEQVKVDLFMKLNSRGLELSLPELVKSYFYSVDNIKIFSKKTGKTDELVLAKYYENEIEQYLIEKYFSKSKNKKDKFKSLRDGLAEYFYHYSGYYITEFQNKDSAMSNDKMLFIAMTKLINEVIKKAFEIYKNNSNESVVFLEKFLLDMRKYLDAYIAYSIMGVDLTCKKLKEIDIKKYNALIAFVDMNYSDNTDVKVLQKFKDIIFVFLFFRRLRWIYDNREALKIGAKTNQLLPKTLSCHEITKRIIINKLSIEQAIDEIKKLITPELLRDVHNFTKLDEKIKEKARFKESITNYFNEAVELAKEFEIFIPQNN